MKKRIISILLVFAMVFSMIPAFGITAAAAPTGTPLNTNLGSASLTTGDYYLTGNTTGNISVSEGANVKLDLNGYALIAAAETHTVSVSGSVLTIVDSNPTREHKFTVPDNSGDARIPQKAGLWVLDESNGKEVIKGGCITGGNFDSTNTLGGGGIYVNGGTLKMLAGTVVGNQACSGGGIYVNSGTAEIAGDIIGNYAFTYKSLYGGGGLTVYGTSSDVDVSGKVAHNSTAYAGGGILLRSGSLSMSGEVSENLTAVTGGGMQVSGTGECLVSGIITGNYADCSANVNSIFGGGVYMYNTNFLLSDTAQIYGNTEKYNFNTAGYLDSNLYLYNGATVSVSTSKPLTGAANIGVTLSGRNKGTVTTNANKDYAAYFKSDVTKYAAKNTGTGANQTVVIDDPVAIVVETDKGFGSVQEAVDEVKDNGYTVKLLDDTKENVVIRNSGTCYDVVLDLNGHVIKALDGEKAVISVYGKLELMDSDSGKKHAGEYIGLPDGGVITGTTSNAGIMIDGGELNMSGGTISDNKGLAAGGIYNNGTVTITGGAVSDNKMTTSDGGGIYNSGKLYLGGTAKIVNNRRTDGTVSNLYIPSANTEKIVIGTKTGNTEKTKGNGITAPVEKNGAKPSCPYMLVGVTLQKATGDLTENGGDNEKQFFFSDNIAYKLEVVNAGKDTEHLKLSNYPLAEITDETVRIYPDDDALAEDIAVASAKVQMKHTSLEKETVIAFAKASDFETSKKYLTIKADSSNDWKTGTPMTLAAMRAGLDDADAYIMGRIGEHIHEWTYSVSGDTLTATCENSDSGHKGSLSETLTIVAPEKETYGDGNDKDATLSKTAVGGLTVSANNIKYYEKLSSGSYGTTPISAPTKAGSYKAVFTVNDGTADRTISIKYDIAKKELTVTGTSVQDKTYDGNTSATVTAKGSLTGVVSDDKVSIDTATAEFENKKAGTGKKVSVSYTLTGDDADNYTAKNSEVYAGISQKELTVSGTTVSGKTYNGNAVASVTAGTLQGIVDDDDVSVNTATGTFDDGETVGTNKDVTVVYTLKGGDAANYTVSSSAHKASISKKSVTVSGTTASNKTYDAKTAAQAAMTDSWKSDICAGDDAEVSVKSANFANKNVDTDKTVEVEYEISGEDAGNYTVVSNETVKANITAAALTVNGTAVKDSKAYDGTKAVTVTAKGTLQGIQSNEEGTADDVTIDTATAEYGDKDTGKNKKVTVSYTLSGADASNYTVSNSELKADITAKTVTVKPDADQSKTYGDADPTLTYTFDGVINGETAAFKGGLSRKEGEDVNEDGYAISIGTLALKDNGAFKAANYELVLDETDIFFHIAKSNAMTISANSFDGKYDGVAHGDAATPSVTEGTTVTYSVDGGENWSEDVPTVLNAGSASVIAKAENKNYVDATCEYTVKVNKRSVTLTSASDTKEVDGEPLVKNSVEVTGDGFAESEGAEYEVTGSQTEIGNSENTFTYKLNEGTDKDNYDILTVFGTLTVTEIQDICIYSTAPSAGEHTLLLGKQDAGKVIISGNSKEGFQIKQGEKYLALDGDKVVLSDAAYTWKYDGGLYGETTTKTYNRVRGWFGWFFGHYNTKTVTSKVYLDFANGAFTSSSYFVAAEVKMSAKTHTWGYLHDGDGKHEAYCTCCGVHETPVAHDYSFDAENHKCVCGKTEPNTSTEEGGTTQKEPVVQSDWWIRVSERATRHFFWWNGRGRNATKYQYSICPVGCCDAKSVKYSLDGGKTWYNGNCFSNTKKLNDFDIQITDKNGEVTNWGYTNGKVCKN